MRKMMLPSLKSYHRYLLFCIMISICDFRYVRASQFVDFDQASVLRKMDLSPVIKAESVSFLDLNGQSKYLYQFEGKVVLLFFWATWSVACTGDLEKLDNLQKDFRKLPFEIIALVVDSKDLSFIQKYVDAQNFSHLKVYLDSKKQLFRAFDITSLPASFLISANGEELYKFTNSPHWNYDSVRSVILAHIGSEYVLPFNSYQSRALNNKPKVIKDDAMHDVSDVNKNNYGNAEQKEGALQSSQELVTNKEAVIDAQKQVTSTSEAHNTSENKETENAVNKPDANNSSSDKYDSTKSTKDTKRKRKKASKN